MSEFAKFDSIIRGNSPATFRMTLVRRSPVVNNRNKKVLTFSHIHVRGGIHIMCPIKCFCADNSQLGKLKIGTTFRINSYLRHGIDHGLWLSKPIDLRIVYHAHSNPLLSRMRSYILGHQKKAHQNR